MTSASIFGIALAPLFAAIAEVESENGKTSDNVYQLTISYVVDVNNIRINKGQSWFYFIDCADRAKSKRMMLTYWRHYGEQYRRTTGKNPTAEVLARIHNGGPDGWRKESTLKYWHKVKAVMDAAEKEGETKCK